jgi:hypothetical protein
MKMWVTPRRDIEVRCGEARGCFCTAAMCVHRYSILCVAVVDSERSVCVHEERYARVYKDGVAHSSVQQCVGGQQCMQRGKCVSEVQVRHGSGHSACTHGSGHKSR